MMNTKEEPDTNKIKKVLICGLGGLGCLCASKIKDSNSAELKILVDKNRLDKYKKCKTSFNSKEYEFDYILPDNNDFKADLIIIATKADGLNKAVKEIKNFVTEKTLFISLLNGIHSENVISKFYKKENILTCFYIGHSCIREGRKITQDGTYKLVIGGLEKETLKEVTTFFENAKIDYEVCDNIQEEYWKKFIINVGINQLSAVTGLTLKEIRKDKILSKKLKDLMYEAFLIAEKEGIKASKEIYESAVNFLFNELEDATPSMLQDIKAKRKTEVDIFAGTIIKLGKKYNINTPENSKIYNKIKELDT